MKMVKTKNREESVETKLEHLHCQVSSLPIKLWYYGGIGTLIDG